MRVVDQCPSVPVGRRAIETQDLGFRRLAFDNLHRPFLSANECGNKKQNEERPHGDQWLEPHHNAVPPVLAEAIARSFMRGLERS